MTRWDIIATPPDILVTNYSMLNAMLMRDIEDQLFDKTAVWLRSDPENVFTLVVDDFTSIAAHREPRSRWSFET